MPNFDYSSSFSLISEALSDLTTPMRIWVRRSSVSFHLSSLPITSAFVLARIVHVLRVALSIIWTNYLFLRTVSKNGPTTSIETSTRTDSFYGLSTLLVRFRSLVSLQTLHISLSVRTRTGRFNVVTLYRFRNFSGPKWANRRYMSR